MCCQLGLWKSDIMDFFIRPFLFHWKKFVLWLKRPAKSFDLNARHKKTKSTSVLKYALFAEVPWYSGGWFSISVQIVIVSRVIAGFLLSGATIVRFIELMNQQNSIKIPELRLIAGIFVSSKPGFDTNLTYCAWNRSKFVRITKNSSTMEGETFPYYPLRSTLKLAIPL